MNTLKLSISSRFFSNGQVLSLLANEEFNPQQVVPLLKPTLRIKVCLRTTLSSITQLLHDVDTTGFIHWSVSSLRHNCSRRGPNRREWQIPQHCSCVIRYRTYIHTLHLSDDPQFTFASTWTMEQAGYRGV